MAEGAIIFLLKVVYFSIERWCTFGLTNTIVNYIIKRHEEVLKPSKKALKSFKRTLLTASEDLLKRELKDTERLLTTFETA